MRKCRSASLSSTVEEKQVKLRHYLLIEEKTAAEPKLLVSGDTRKKKNLWLREASLEVSLLAVSRTVFRGVDVAALTGTVPGPAGSSRTLPGLPGSGCVRSAPVQENVTGI